jgi:NAD-dependent dihydropyrimidine dehydrogenase PreA subunit
MIELISEERCVSCNICVNVCPTGVFEKVEGNQPIIARVDDCQTCFMCEVYCPVDALYVDPNADVLTGVTESYLEENGLFGAYRQNVGFGNKKK